MPEVSYKLAVCKFHTDLSYIYLCQIHKCSNKFHGYYIFVMFYVTEHEVYHSHKC